LKWSISCLVFCNWRTRTHGSINFSNNILWVTKITDTALTTVFFFYSSPSHTPLAYSRMPFVPLRPSYYSTFASWIHVWLSLYHTPQRLGVVADLQPPWMDGIRITFVANSFGSILTLQMVRLRNIKKITISTEAKIK